MRGGKSRSSQGHRSRRRRRIYEHADDNSGNPPSGIVAIVGRPNVGKSTLFNRLTGRREAIVDEMAGLTRDRLYGIAEWRGRRFTVVDTAGLDMDAAAVGDDKSARDLAKGTQHQARLAIAEADVCCFMLDIHDGVTPLDEDVAEAMRFGGKPVIVVGNKADSAGNPQWAHELHALGLGDPLLISAQQGRDVGDLLDRVVELLPPAVAEQGNNDMVRVAIIGRPNVGKSSLLNALVGEERALVSSMPGTTRDAVDTLMHYRDRVVELVDTAGIRRRGVVESNVEHYSLLRSLRAIERCDVAVVVVDGNAGIVAQDRHIAGYAADAGKGLVVVVNKWDLVGPASRADPGFLKAVQSAFAFVPGCPILTVSALQRRHISKVVDTVLTVADTRAIHVPTPALNTLLRDAMDRRPPRVHKGNRLKLLYATQAQTRTPTFVLFVNDPDQLHFAYRRYLENTIRAVFGFAGVTIRIVARRRGDEDAAA